MSSLHQLSSISKLFASGNHQKLNRRAIPVEEFQRRAEVKNTARVGPSPLAIVVRYGMVRRLICGAVQELVVVPAGDGLVRRRVGDFQA